MEHREANIEREKRSHDRTKRIYKKERKIDE